MNSIASTDVQPSPSFSPSTASVESGLIDFAGVDGLQLAISLFGSSVQHISPFQSLEVSWQLNFEESDRSDANGSGVLLRLCENNFRLRHFSNTANLIKSFEPNLLPKQVWMRSLPWLGSVTYSLSISPTILDNLQKKFVPTPPHQLFNIPFHQAAVGRIDGQAVLVWVYTMGDRAVVELQAANSHLEAIVTSTDTVLKHH